MIVDCPDCGKKNRVPAVATGRPRCAHCHHDLPWLAEAADADFTDVVERSPLPVVVDLWAPWCGPCRMMAPAYEQAAAQLEPRVQLVKVNTEEAQGLGAQLNIRSIPTLALFIGGREVARQAGAMGTADIVRWTESQLSRAFTTA